MLPWVLGGLIVAGAALAAWLFFRRRKRDQALQRAWEHQQSQRWMEQMAADHAVAQEKTQSDNHAQVRELLEGDDSDLAQLMLDLAGISQGSPREVAQDDEMIRQISQSLSHEQINVLSFASRTNDQFDTIDLTVRTELEPSAYPADRYELEPMRDLSQIADVVPDQLAYDDALFYAFVGDENFTVVQHYREVPQKKLMYILLDVSGSMNGDMRGGGTRIQWAAGVALRLMMRAQAGEAEFLIRFFGNAPYELHVIRTPQQAREFAQKLVRLRDYNEGTDINLALRTAVDDVQTADTTTSDILLITDGEANVDEAWLRQTFGENLRLHVAMIGNGTRHNALSDLDVVSSFNSYR